MALNQDSLDRLFSLAVEDAQPTRGAVLIPARTRPSAWSDGGEGFLKLPGPEPFTWRDLVEPELRELANADRDVHRIVVLVHHELDQQTALGQMAWSLALARAWERSPATYEFGFFLARAIERTYVGTGLGSAAIFHRVPLLRDANAAAAQLVDRVFGAPTRAEYFGEHGNLLRPIGSPDPETLSRRLVVFAFLHRGDVEAHAVAQGEPYDQLLARMDLEAPTWWRALATDPALVKSSATATALLPTKEQIILADVPIKAWWDYLSRIDHDEDHGLAVIEQMT